jgi:hypothetical protein
LTLFGDKTRVMEMDGGLHGSHLFQAGS